MNKYIEKVKEKLETLKIALKNVPNWGIEEVKEYYLSQVPKMVKECSSQRSKEEIESELYEEITEKLATDIETQRAEIQEELRNKIQKSELLISHYFICCQEYGKEIEISSEKDITVETINDMYTMICVPKVKLSLLYDRNNNSHV